MRLVAYVRVSSEGQTDGYGLKIQEAEVRKWARANGHRITQTFTDAGVSGAKDHADRPGLSAALVEVSERRAEGLLIPKLDRLARAVTVQEAALALVWRDGGRVFAADQGEVMRDDPDDPMRTAMREMAGVFAGLERRMIVKRMRDGRRAKAATGRKAVGQYAFGYRGEGRGRERDAAPDPEEQRAVLLICRRRREGASYRVIVAELESAGIKPRRADHWSAMTVRSVARRHNCA
jgi:DNA invertase Pin-like site-specific DNA recombinase